MCGGRAVSSLRSFAGADRILVGSDHPFMPESFSSATGHAVADLGAFSAAEWATVNRHNAERLFPRFRRTER